MSSASESIGVLHLLLCAEEAVWRDCLQCCMPTDSVVLMDAGVMGLNGSCGNLVSEFPCPVVVSGLDHEARMGPRAGRGGEPDLVDDEEIVRMLETHWRCLSWR